MRYTVRPLSDRTWLRPPNRRQRSRFDTNWGSTQKLLGREIDLLGGRNVVIEIDIREQDLKLNGELRSNARTPEHPAVVVAFETDAHGAMLYRCDRYYAPYYGQIDWQHNVRAIALTLEALRAVSRHGATETGQQYAGFKAISWSGGMSRTEALAIVTMQAEMPLDDVKADLRKACRRARAKAHPDRHGGSQEYWDKVEQAAKILGVS